MVEMPLSTEAGMYKTNTLTGELTLTVESSMPLLARQSLLHLHSTQISRAAASTRTTRTRSSAQGHGRHGGGDKWSIPPRISAGNCGGVQQPHV